MNITGPFQKIREECEQILRSLPGWFGIESSLIAYADATERLPTFAVLIDKVIAGFVTLECHSEHEWEIHCIAVHDRFRQRGIGSALLLHAEGWLKKEGAKVLFVRTIAESHPSSEYRESRAFYSRQGFAHDKIIPDIWGPSNPCLQMRKELVSTV